MEKEQIIQRIRGLHTKQDLLDLLNDLKIDEYKGEPHLFTMKQLMYYCNSYKHDGRYKTFLVQKKKKGEYRTISAPSGALKNIQHFINVMLSSLYVPSNSVTGFVEGKSVVDNAKMHIGMNYVLNIDLENFFPSIHQVRIWSLLQKKPYSFNKEIANIIAGLCAIKHPKEGVQEPKDDKTDFDYVLPQGAPTSPLLSNISCEHLDRSLQRLAKTFGLNYSRYADDITFSSEDFVYSRRGNFWKKLREIISEHRLRINESKTRLLRKGRRQEVTGLTVNSKVNVSKRYVLEIRRHLNTWEKYGYAVAYKNFYPKYNMEKGHVKKGEPELVNVLSGKLLYLKMVKGGEDPVYTKLRERFDKLVFGYENAFRIGGIQYISTTKLNEFERTMETNVQCKNDKRGNPLYIFDNKGIEKRLEISKTADFKEKDNLYVSLCRNEEGKLFYLIHNELKSKNEDQKKKLELDKVLSSLVEGGKLNLGIFDQKKQAEKIIFQDTMSVSDFEKKHLCEIKLANDKKYAFFEKNGETVKVSLSQKLIIEEYRKYDISLCCKNEGKPFYMIHCKPSFLSIE